jgi:hypothetical protein
MTSLITNCILSILIITSIGFSAESGRAIVSGEAVANPAIVKNSYRETSEGKSTVVSWSQTINDNSRQIKNISSSDIEVIDGLHSVEQYSFKTPQKTLSVRVNTKDEAVVVVTENGKTSTENISLNNTPIMYPPSFFMSKFIQSKDKRTFAWSINKKENSLRQMIFTKVDEENIAIDGIPYDCIKVEMKPTGIAGTFWKAYYWFDKTSGEYLKYVGKKGPPGTPNFIIEKVNQSN